MREQEKEREENAGRRPQSVDAGGSLAQNKGMDNYSEKIARRILDAAGHETDQASSWKNIPKDVLRRAIKRVNPDYTVSEAKKLLNELADFQSGGVRTGPKYGGGSFSNNNPPIEKGPGSMNDIDEILKAMGYGNGKYGPAFKGSDKASVMEAMRKSKGVTPYMKNGVPDMAEKARWDALSGRGGGIPPAGGQQMIEELVNQSPARRVINPEVMPRGGGMPGMGGPVPRLPNMAIPTTGGTLPPAAAGASMLPMAGMVGAGMLIPSMIGGQTGPEAARGQIDRLATQQGRVLPSPGFSQEETNAMIDSVLQGPSKRPKMELYGAMEPGSDPELEMARMKSVKDSNPAKSPAPMDDGAIDELIGFGGKSTTPTESAMRSKVMPTDDSILTDVVGGGLPKKTYRVKGASSGEEADSAASAADFVDRGRKKGINTYSGKKKKRKYDLLEE